MTALFLRFWLIGQEGRNASHETLDVVQIGNISFRETRRQYLTKFPIGGARFDRN